MLGIGIFCGSFVPEGEVTVASEEVGAEDASVVAETGQGVGFECNPYYGNGRVVTSSPLADKKRRDEWKAPDAQK